jgi:hypothetical protein
MNIRIAAFALCAAVSLPTLGAAPAAAQTAPAILVVGGTAAGVAAAVSAARAGANVTLVAARPQLGGILSDGMMDQWDLNVAPDGADVQGGLFREIHAMLGDAFTPDAAAHAFAALVAGEPRIHLVVNEKPVGVTTALTADGRRVDAVEFRGARNLTIAAQSVIDATDDGDVAALAGARYDLGRQDTGIDERMQPVTLLYTLQGVDWQRVLDSYDPARFGPGGAIDVRAWGYADLVRAYRPQSSEVLVPDLNFGREPDGAVTVNAIDVLDIDGRRDADLARARALTEREAPHLLAFLRSRIPGFEHATIGRYARQIYVRETRHFAGLEQLTADDVWDGVIPADTIGLSSYPMDLHPVTATTPLAYAPIRHVYGIPFGTLVPRDLSNVLLASPAISATHVAAGSARVIPSTIEEGEAAGIAAALAARDRVSFEQFAADRGDIAALRDRLSDDGAELAYREPTRGRVIAQK